MLSLSHTTGYAILAMSCLHRCGERLMSTRDVAACTGIRQPYLAKILHTLVRSGLIAAKRGYRGGFSLTRAADQISFYDIAVAIEGEAFLPTCMLGLGTQLRGRACPGRSFWQRERQRIARHLRRMTLVDVKVWRQGGRAGCGKGGSAAWVDPSEPARRRREHDPIRSRS